MNLRSKVIRLAHQNPDLREHLLPLVKTAGPPVEREFTDEELLSAAAEAAKQDPKKRFTATSLKAVLKKREGDPEYLVVKPSLERRLRDLASAPIATRKIVPDRARGYYIFVKTTKGEGVEFRSSGGGDFDILVNGEQLGEISVQDGDFIHGSSRQREKVYRIDLNDEEDKFVGPKTPPEFKKLTDAKAWVKKNLGA